MSYKVKAGDTLYSIYGPNWKQLSGYTGDPTKLQIGTMLPDPPGATPSGPVTPSVIDNFWSKTGISNPGGTPPPTTPVTPAVIDNFWAGTGIGNPSGTGGTGGTGGGSTNPPGDNGGTLPAPPAEPPGDGSATGNPQLDKLLEQMQQVLDAQIAAGQKINPQPTPEMIAKWANEASAKLDPYYQQQYKSISAELTSGLQNLQKQYDLDVQAKQEKFRAELGLQSETAADRGTTFSGGRVQKEIDTQTSANRDLQSLELGVRNSAQNTLYPQERSLGSLNLGGINIPQLTSYSANRAGGGTTTSRDTSSLYTPVGGIVGSMERQNELDKYEYQKNAKYNWLMGQNI